MSMLKKFVNSRKFWIALVGFVTALVLFLQGQINSDALINAVLVLTGIRWLGAITPVGGLAFLVGWFSLAFAAIRAGSRAH